MTSHCVAVSGIGMQQHFYSYSTAHNGPQNELWARKQYKKCDLATVPPADFSVAAHEAHGSSHVSCLLCYGLCACKVFPFFTNLTGHQLLIFYYNTLHNKVSTEVAPERASEASDFNQYYRALGRYSCLVRAKS